MVQPRRPVNIHKAYHAHIYFDNETVEFATRLCGQVGTLFGLKEQIKEVRIGNVDWAGEDVRLQPGQSVGCTSAFTGTKALVAASRKHFTTACAMSSGKAVIQGRA